MDKVFYDAASGLSALGFEVFPVHTITPVGGCSCGRSDCDRAGKHPVVSWKEAATSDAANVAALADRHPSMNVAVATGARSGIVVLDVDTAGGKGGAESLRALEERHGTLPPTVRARTGSGGLHYYFRHPGVGVKNSVSELAPGLDVRGDGGYVVAPPSLHVSGGRYAWCTGLAPDEVELAALPPWMREALTADRRPSTSPRRSVTQRRVSAENRSRATVEEGGRNDFLFRLACRMRSQGLTPAAITAALHEENAACCVPPLDEHEVERVASNAARYEPGGGEHPLTDLGNAERFVREHGAHLRYHADRGLWLNYDGGVWSEDSAEAVQKRAKRTVRRIAVAAEFAASEGERKAILAHAKRSESRTAITNMLSLAQGEPGVGVTSSELDADPWLLNALNGTVDLRTGTLREHRAEDLLSKRAAFAYDEGAGCPRFEAFLLQVTGGDEAMVAFLQRALGYSATGLTTEQVLFFLYGDGANGKSVFAETVMHVLGSYAQKAPTEMLVERRYSGIPNDVARLAGARLVVAAEASEGVALDEARVKDLTGGDKIVARHMRQEFFEFAPTHALWAYGNHKPLIRGTDEGIWRRLRFIPFDVSIPEGRRDPMLKEKLLAEGDGILRWIVEGCLGWQRVGLRPPEKVLRLSQAHRVEMDQTRRFLEEACEQEDGAEEEVGVLYDAYTTWCRTGGEEPVTKAMFGRKLGELGFRERRSSRARYRLGVRVAKDQWRSNVVTTL